MYKHHDLSISIIFLGLLILKLMDIKFKDSFSIQIILISYGSLCIHYLYTLNDIVIYQILYIKDFDINLFLLFIGILRLLFGFTFSFINNYKNFNINLFDEISNISKQDLLTIVFIFINCITLAIQNAVSILILKLFKPWFFEIAFSFREFIDLLFFINEKEQNRIYKIILKILIIIGYLIFCEIIICNFYGLNKNTKKEIVKRSELETKDLLSSELSQIN